MAINEAFVLSGDQADAIIRAAVNVRDRAWIALLYEACLRPIEAANLKWRDLDFSDERIDLTIYDPRLGTYDPRHAYVYSRASYIRELREAHATDGPDDFVFRAYEGRRISSQPVSRSAMRTALYKAANKAGVIMPMPSHRGLVRKLNGNVPPVVAKTTWSAGMAFERHEIRSEEEFNRRIKK